MKLRVQCRRWLSSSSTTLGTSSAASRLRSPNHTSFLHNAVAVVSAWQSGGSINMDQLQSALRRQGWLMECYPCLHSSSHNHPKLSVIVARLPHNLKDQFGNPPKKGAWLTHSMTYSSDLSSKSDEFNHHSTADQRWNASFWNDNPRGFVFLFSSGAIVSWGYSGSDRDWMDEWIGDNFQDYSKKWPVLHGLPLLPLFPALRLHLRGYLLFDRDVLITRKHFSRLNWSLTKHERFNKISKRELSQWTVSDVQLWLRTVGLSDYSDSFLKNGIDGTVLVRTMIADFGKSSATLALDSSNSAWVQTLIPRVCDQFRFADEVAKLALLPNDLFTASDELCLPNTELTTLLSISLSLAQNARLQALQIALGFYLRQMNGLNDVYLSNKGHVRWMGANHWSRLAHHIDLLMDMVYDRSVEPTLTRGLPDLLWERADLEPLFEVMSEYLDYESTLDHCVSQMTTLRERYQSEWHASTDRVGHRLEWIIIFFLFVECRDLWLPLFYRLRSAKQCRQQSNQHRNEIPRLITQYE